MAYAVISTAFSALGAPKVPAAPSPSMSFTEDGLALGTFVASLFAAPSAPTVCNAAP